MRGRDRGIGKKYWVVKDGDGGNGITVRCDGIENQETPIEGGKKKKKRTNQIKIVSKSHQCTP